jgi:hypothetical protein
VLVVAEDLIGRALVQHRQGVGASQRGTPERQLGSALH